MSLSPGSKLGPYEILSPLGAGGMGEVYRARDPRLGREVAIKVLPGDAMADEGRRRRFIQEARAASALNHPHIVTIHEIEASDGIDYIVMEYVAGKTLDALLHSKMRLSEAVGLAIPIADALARAHAAGIVHRDLKPSNVAVSSEGVVKVLDFGLAKLVHGEEDDPVEGATLTAAGALSPLTGAGTIAGTPGYMSPEQATGGRVDARSDVFSFGALLYEMVTGRRAFKKSSAAETLAAVVHAEPTPRQELVPGVPRDLEKLILRCLRKEPDRRFQNILDVKLELQEIKEECDSRPALTPAATARRRLARAALGFAGLLFLLGAGALLLRFRETQRPLPRVVPLTTAPGTEGGAAFSPDGAQIAFSWEGGRQPEGESANVDIWLKFVDGSEMRRLTTDLAFDTAPAWSPDGRQIAFQRRAGPAPSPYGIYLVSPLGGPERKLCDFPADGYQLSWTPDGRWLAAARSDEAKAAAPQAPGIYLVSLAEGQARPFRAPPKEGYDWLPAFSPSGDRLAYAHCVTERCDLRIASLGPDAVPRGEARTVAEGVGATSGLAWSRDAESLIYATVQSWVFHLRRVAVSGGRPPESVELAGRGVWEPATVASRDRLAFTRDLSDVDLYGFRPGRPSQPLVAASFNDQAPSMSPDGRRIAFSSGRSGGQECWLANADGSNPVQLTHGPGLHQGSPRWSPDGSRVAFGSLGHDRQWDIWTIAPDGSSLRRVTEGPGDKQWPSWSRDGRFVYFGSNRGGTFELWRMPVTGGSPERPTTHDGAYNAAESWDGRTLVFDRYQANSPLLAQPLAGGPVRQLASCIQNLGFAIGPEGVYYLECAHGQSEAPLHLLDLKTGHDRVLGQLETGRLNPFVGMAVSPTDGTVIFARWVIEGSDILMIENFR